MKFHHMCIVTTNLQGQIAMWRDLLGFEVAAELVIPDGEEWFPSVRASRQLVNDLYEMPGASAKVGVMISKDGAMIELLEPQMPAVEQTPLKNLRYRHTGIHELGLATENIDAFFEKVKTQGYALQTDYIWRCANLGRSFMFYDPDGNLIQIWEHSPEMLAQMNVT